MKFYALAGLLIVFSVVALFAVATAIGTARREKAAKRHAWWCNRITGVR